MKKLVLAVLIFSPLFIQAQTDSTSNWNKGGRIGLTFNQATLTNWAAGGFSSISGGAYYNQFFDYTKDDNYWKTSLEMGYGLIRESGEDTRKTDDKIILISNYGKSIGSKKRWFYSAMVDFRTQFAEGFDDADAPSKISEFMAPGYLIGSAGFTYKPTDYFTASVGPLSTKMTFVLNQDLADLGSFGVEGAEVDNNGNIIVGTGQKFRGEFGATATVTFNKEIFKNVTYATNLLLFTDYIEAPEKIDVNWDNTITFKVNDVFSAMFFFQTIYDYDIKFDVLDDNGDLIRQEDRWQFKTLLSISLAYNFGGTRG